MGANREQATPAQQQAKAVEGESKAQSSAAGPQTAWQGYMKSLRSPVQAKGEAKSGEASVQEAAAQGVAGGGSRLPHLEKIQQSFGGHDVGGVNAHVGGQAQAASERIGAQAYATGNDVAFKSSPDLHTAAHEAAHVVQQRGGVQLKDGVGRSGDEYERHADAVADAVVAGKSAEALLDQKGGGSGGSTAVQCLGERLDKALPDKAQTPGHGSLNPGTHAQEDKEYRGATTQRRYTVEQYVEMWEQERGRKMSDQEKATLARGCIGITAVNIEAVNPPLDHAYGTFDQAMAVVNEWNAFIEKNKGKETADGQKIGDFKAVLFAKLFWSNQRDFDPAMSDEENRKENAKPDDKAFKPDAKTGKVDMTGYKYQGQPNMSSGGWYVNFDYGFWDEETQCFWHANHAQPGMKVYQSTKEKFTKGYIDFDRIIFCAAMAKKYNPKGAAETHG